MLDQRLTECVAFLCVGHTLVKQADRHAEHLSPHHVTLIIEIIHNGVKALMLFAHQMVGRNAAIFKVKRCRVGRPPTHFAFDRRPGKTGRIGIDKKERNASHTFTTCAGANDKIGCLNATGNEHFLAVQHPFISITVGHCFHVCDI